MANTQHPTNLPPEPIFFGSSQAMQMVRSQLNRLAGANMPVFIHGESGTGKEVLARLMHIHSPWSEGPFVKVSCPAVPGSLLESELFGYEPGAFTGAFSTKSGRFEMARPGTLFLDEIGELDASLQAKLLQVLQDGQFCRIGALTDQPVETRLICATNRNLSAEIAAGNFRQDLFYRINVLNVWLPPLRERREDIPELAAYFIQLCNEKFSCIAKPFSPHLMRLLQDHDWPGNLRELENLVRRYVVFGSEEPIASELLGRKLISPLTASLSLDSSLSLKEITRQATRDLERQVILRSLQAHNWNRRRVALALRISYRALLYKIQNAGISAKRSHRKKQTEADPENGVPARVA